MFDNTSQFAKLRYEGYKKLSEEKLSCRDAMNAPEINPKRALPKLVTPFFYVEKYVYLCGCKSYDIRP